MSGSAVDTLQLFRTVEDDQKYTRLVDLFADDAVYYDPFYGPQRGTDAIRGFMEHMEKTVPGSGAAFANWSIEADTECGWAEWDMTMPDASGTLVPVPGQSLYRLRDGRVTFVADHVDTDAWRRLRGDDAQFPDHVSSIGLSAVADQQGGAAYDVITSFWEMRDGGRASELGSLFAENGRFVTPLRDTFTGGPAIDRLMAEMAVEVSATGASSEVVDIAGDDTVGWAQWWLHLPNGKAPCWTLFTVRDGAIAFARDVVDMAIVGRLTASS